MGRPLYSRAFKTTPAVREPEEPSYGHWSYRNAFDPDSDEFFDDENAVYEDFIGPTASVTIPPLHDDEEVVEERDMVVVRVGNVSPISSESSLSDSDVSLPRDDPAHLVVDAIHDARRVDEAEASLEEPAVRVRLAARALPGEVRRASQTLDAERPQPRRMLTARSARRGPYVYHLPRIEPVHVAVPPRSAPIPVPAASRRSAVSDDRMLSSPSTPPRQTPVASYLPMSPPPSSTPRIYTWARNPSHPPASPSSSGPLTNPHARTSYTHLSPAFLRFRDVTV